MFSFFLFADTLLYTLPCRSVRRSVTFLNCEQFPHHCSCPTVRDWIAVYPALFQLKHPHLFVTIDTFVREKLFRETRQWAENVHCVVYHKSTAFLHNKARYTATLVACGWAEAVLEEITRDREFGLFITTKRLLQ